MSGAGTLLSDLMEGTGGADGDLVNKILSDMNATSGQAPTQRPLAPPLPASLPIPQQQIAPSMQTMTMDSQIPTSHVIGNQHPTPADFAAAVHGVNYPSGAMGQGMGMGMGSPLQQGQYMQQGMMMPGVGSAPSKNFYGKVLDECKVPFVVGLLFFVFSLPFVKVLLSHYLPSLLKSTGDFQLTGLLAVSLLVAIVFWILQRVIAPLLSL